MSLVDCYWIKPVGSSYTWNEVNLYKNDFRDTFSLDLLVENEKPSLVGKTNFLPSASLSGDLKKKWLINEKDKVRVMVKGNYSDGCLQSLSEVFATCIYDSQMYTTDYVRYGLIQISSNGKKIIGCQCKNFCSESLEFISAYDIVSTVKKPNDVNYYQLYLSILENSGVSCRSVYDLQIMVDFVITNTDRHFNNFGVLRNPDTCELVKIAPIFDSGNSLFYNMGYVPVGRGLLDIDVTSFYNKEVKLLSQVSDRSVLDVRKLPSGDFLYKLLYIDKVLHEEKRERIVKAYLKKIEYLLDFQNGADIWSYNYLKKKG